MPCSHGILPWIISGKVACLPTGLWAPRGSNDAVLILFPQPLADGERETALVSGALRWMQAFDTQVSYTIWMERKTGMLLKIVVKIKQVLQIKDFVFSRLKRGSHRESLSMSVVLTGLWGRGSAIKAVRPTAQFSDQECRWPRTPLCLSLWGEGCWQN